ncbi:Pre-mRNA-splicing factor SPF27 [Haematococcus lacustris]
MAKPLALMQAAYGQAQGWRRGEDLIDALPYIDGLTPEFKQQVDALIDDEMKRSIKRPSDYLRELPPVPAPSFAGSSVLCNEYERVKSGQPMAAIDTSRFRLDPPAASKRNDLAAWKAALDNAHSQLEHQYTRILNLELVLKYGDKTWRAQNQLNEVTLKQVEVEAAALAKAKNDLNQARKLAQTLAGQELSRAHTEYYSLVRKNFEIERACQVLEEQVRAEAWLSG